MYIYTRIETLPSMVYSWDMSILSEELNKCLKDTQAGFLLSKLGASLYFPKGIVAQSAEAAAKADRYNATAGMAFNEGNPLILHGMDESISGMNTSEFITYAPTPGVMELRKLWLEEIHKKNPDLNGKHTSLPMVVPGLTSGISNTADLFLDPEDTVVIPDLYWGNYNLIFTVRKQVNIKTFTFFNESGAINSEALKESLIQGAKGGKVSLLLNFPNNPTGYSPNRDEAEAIKNVLYEVAETGIKILLITDDAYFGLFYEDNIYTQSIFSVAADLHENILAVKVDGATKEDYSWGLRVGFITFAGKGLTKDHTDALESKLMGSIRSSFSSSSKLSQALVIKALNTPGYSEEKIKYEEIMRKRYLKVKSILERRTTGKALTEYPFNSGYFMTFKTAPGFNEKLRVELLKHGIGTVALGDTSFRIAFSAVDECNLEDLYETIFRVSDSLQ